MKKMILTILAGLLIGLDAYAQGTISFKNRNSSPVINAPVTHNDGVTKLSGSQYFAGLMAGTTANNLTQVGGVQTPFLTGAAAGYFFGGPVTLPGIPGGSTAFIEVVVWSSAFPNFASAIASGLDDVWGMSGWSTGPLSVVTGNPNEFPPTTPAFLVGLTPFSLNVNIPEPSALALVGLGAAAVLVFRRRE